MKFKILVLALFVVPVFASANTITVEYTKEDNETVEQVAEKFAEKYDVSVESVWIWDYENSPKNFLYVRVPDKNFEATQAAKATSTSNELESRVTALEAENAQLKSKISLLEQIISLLKTIVGLRQ
jgi:hypothetical protein